MGDRLAIIMAGGAGTRLWPASLPGRPKHVTPGLGGRGENGEPVSLLQRTLRRISTLIPLGGVRVVTTRDQGPLILDDIPALTPGQLVLEPEGRNTAACVALAVASCLRADGPDALLHLLPADHHVSDEAAFVRALERAGSLALARDTICTLGITPTRPHTGYGYIEHAQAPLANDAAPPAFEVRRFTEKPDAQTAQRMLDQGGHLWNAGIFIGTAGTFARALEHHCQDLWSTVAAGLDGGAASLDQAYATLPSVPIDVALMEKLDRLLVVSCDAGWSDLGSWQAVFEHLGAADPVGGVSLESGTGRARLQDAEGNLVWAEDADVAVLGVQGLAVIAVGGRVLVCPLDQAEAIKALVQQLN